MILYTRDNQELNITDIIKLSCEDVNSLLDKFCCLEDILPSTAVAVILLTSDKHVYLSWFINKTGANHAIRYSKHENAWYSSVFGVHMLPDCIFDEFEAMRGDK